MRRLRQLNLGWCACIGDSEVAVLQGHAALAQLMLSGTQVSHPQDLRSSCRARPEGPEQLPCTGLHLILWAVRAAQRSGPSSTHKLCAQCDF